MSESNRPGAPTKQNANAPPPATSTTFFSGDAFPAATKQSSSAAAAVPEHPIAVPVAMSSHSHMIVAGLVSGVSVAGLFNPWDRALYLSVLHSRPFLSRSNFVHPYQGFLQVVVHRTLSGGLYFPLFDMAQPFVKTIISRACQHQPHPPTAAEQSALLHFVCGNFAGGVSGVLLNGLTAVKYASWDARTGFFLTAKNMYRAGGFRPFTKGINATVIRDTIFGGVFAIVKFELVKIFRPYVKVDQPLSGVSKTTAAALVAAAKSHPPAQSHAFAVPPGATGQRFQFSAGTADFSAALLAGLMATTVSAPFNYVRNIKYGWPSETKPPPSYRILIDLWKEARASGRIASHLQERLRLGWGTARVAFGMATGQFLYEATKLRLDQRPSTKH